MIPTVHVSRDQNSAFSWLQIQNFMLRHDECMEHRSFRHDEETTDSGSAPFVDFSPQMCFPDLSDHLAGFLQGLWTRFKQKNPKTMKQLIKEPQFIRENQTLQGGSLLPVACRRTPCAAGPCPPIQSAGRWGGQIYTAGRQARSGGCPSHGWPGSASLLSAHCGGERERGSRPNRWLRTRRQDGPVIVTVPQMEGLEFDLPGGGACQSIELLKYELWVKYNMFIPIEL